MAYHVYILKSVKDGSLYIGHTQDLEKRLKQHNSPTRKTYTAKRGPWERVHSEPFDTRAEAMTRDSEQA
jgi:predicted GIY-YIG superfamily endonuclease